MKPFKITLRILLLFCFSAMSTSICHSGTNYQFLVDGIGYLVNPDSTTVSVANYYDSDILFFDGGIYSELEEISIPDSVEFNGKIYTVTRIDEDAFKRCEKLRKVTLPNSIKVLGYYSFMFCNSLEYINLPEGLEEIGAQAFAECNFSELVIPSTLKRIYYSAIGNIGLTKLTWNAVNCSSANGNYSKSFIWADFLEEVIIGDGVEIIPYGLCNGAKITNITIPESVKYIEDYAFANTVNLQSIIIPESVQHLGIGVFSGTSNLQSVQIPNSLTAISNRAFENSGITSIVLPESVERIGDYAFSGSALKEFKLPESLTYIGANAFYNCTDLTTVEWNNSLRHIGGSAFQDCVNMTSPIVFPEGFQCVQTAAFARCAKVPMLKSYIMNPQDISTDSIKTVNIGNNKGILSIPYGTRAKYNSVTTESGNYKVWGRFATIVERLTSNGITGNVNGDDTVDGSDANVLINYLLGDEGLVDEDLAGDLNGDGSTDGSDLNALINKLLGE